MCQIQKWRKPSPNCWDLSESLIDDDGVFSRKRSWDFSAGTGLHSVVTDAGGGDPYAKARKDLRRRFQGYCRSVSGSAMDTRHGYSPSFRNQRDRGKRCSTSNKGNSDTDGSKWLARSMVGLCDGMSLPLAQRARQDGPWQDSVWENILCLNRWPFGPVRSHKVSYNPSPSNDEVRLHQSDGKDAFLNLHGIRVTCGWSGELLTADSTDLENLSASHIHVKRFKHQEVAQKESCCFHVQTDLSNSSIFLTLHAAKCPPGGSPEQEQEEDEDTIFEGEKG